jgi:hypothetical protein
MSKYVGNVEQVNMQGYVTLMFIASTYTSIRTRNNGQAFFFFLIYNLHHNRQIFLCNIKPGEFLDFHSSADEVSIVGYDAAPLDISALEDETTTLS